MLENQDILFLSGIRWKFSRQRHQFLATLFSRRNRVLFVEMALSPAHLLKEGRSTAAHWRNWQKGVRIIQPNLFLYTAPPILPFGRSFSAVNNLNQRFICRGAKKAMKLIGMKRPVFWISDPYFSSFVREQGQRLTIFDWIHDDPGGTESRIGRVYRSLRAEIIRRSDIIFTPSRIIYERHGRNDPRFYLVPHGVDLDSFFPRESPSSIPADLETVPLPRIGFSGTIGPAVDRELLNSLAGKLPGYSFVIIGPVQGNVDTLKRRPNVYFLGSRDRKDLPRYLEHLSAGIIPYTISRRTETVHPVKTYEYLAAGLPVVSTNLPELRDLTGTIELADSPDDFLRRLERVLKEDSPEKRAQRQIFARENSWKSRMKKIERIIEEAMAEAPNK